MRFRFGGWFSSLLLAAVFVVVPCTFGLAQWTRIGPEGGDARSLTLDPQNADRIYMGTSSGELYRSQDAGRSWALLARLGGDDFVLDHIALDPKDANAIYVATWNVLEQHAAGDIFRSDDEGKSWQLLPGMHGKSVRALAVAASDSHTLVAGATDGVYRSSDRGDHWERISPAGHADIKNLESIAVDPKNADVVYAGTTHLPWKTSDGGKSWTNIKNGVIDDSDVFSIIVDRTNSSVVYASACSGIYRTENGGEVFRKVQGIPFSARRTRMLKQDPANAQMVYAGTTEGLWRTSDSGKTWSHLTASNVIVNDILIDPRNPARVLLATDRGGLSLSEDGGKTFAASNRGFSHRTVTALLADRQVSGSLFAGVVNDKEFGGVFRSTDAGASWFQSSKGLEGRDVFALRQSPEGFILAGTEHGVMVWSQKLSSWQTANRVVTHTAAVKRPATKSKRAAPVALAKESVATMAARVFDLSVEEPTLWAATSAGLYSSINNSVDWQKVTSLSATSLVAVKSRGAKVFATGRAEAHLSEDNGVTWKRLELPGLAAIRSIAFTPNGHLWIAAREGLYRSTDDGAKWERMAGGLPTHEITAIIFDQPSGRLLLTSASTNMLWQSRDQGQTWDRVGDTGYRLNGATVVNGRIIAATGFNGLVASAQNALSAAVANSGSTQ